jgi:hypothetical protein
MYFVSICENRRVKPVENCSKKGEEERRRRMEGQI